MYSILTNNPMNNSIRLRSSVRSTVLRWSLVFCFLLLLQVTNALKHATSKAYFSAELDVVFRPLTVPLELLTDEQMATKSGVDFVLLLSEPSHVMESFSLAPVAIAPICLAYNIQPFTSVEISVHELGQILTNAAPVQLGVNSGGTVSSAAMKLVTPALSPPRGIMKRVLEALKHELVAGFTNADQFPAAVLNNPNVLLTADASAVATMIKNTPGSFGFTTPMDAAVSHLPCMGIRVTRHGNTKVTRPTFTASEGMWFDVDIQTTSIYVQDHSFAYPIATPVLLYANKTAACTERRQGAYAELEDLVTDDTNELTVGMRNWGFTPLHSIYRTGVLRHMFPILCVDGMRTLKAGGGADYDMQGLIVSYMTTEQGHQVLTDFVPESSIEAQRKVASGVYQFAASELPLQGSLRKAKPSLRSIPLMAYPVSVLVNLPNFHGDVVLPICLLQKIFRRTLLWWDDPEIQEINPDNAMPHHRIVVAGRSGSSGETLVFTHAIHHIDEEHCAPNAAPETYVNITSVWEETDFVADLMGPDVDELLHILREDPYTIAFAPTPESIAHEVASARLLINDTTHLTTGPTSASVALTLNTLAKSEHAGDDLAPGEEEEALVEVDMSANGYPFVGSLHWVFDTDVHTATHSCEDYEAALTYIRWSVESSQPRSQLVANHFVPWPTADLQEAIGAIESVRCNGALLFPPPKKPKPFPYWTIAIMVAVVVLGALLARKLDSYYRVAAAPKDTNTPFIVMFVGPKNISELHHRARDDVPEALDYFSKVVKQECDAHGCYPVKHVGDFHMVTSQRADSACNCAVSIMKRIEETKWDFVCSGTISHDNSRRGECAFSSNGRSSSTQAARGGNAASYRRRPSGRLQRNPSQKEIATKDLTDSSSPVASIGGPYTLSVSDMGSVASHDSVHSQEKGRKKLALKVSIGIHSGKGRIIYDQSKNAYDYTGEVVEAAAVVADVAVPYQILVSEHVEQQSDGRFREFTEKKIGKQKITLYQLLSEELKHRDAVVPVNEEEDTGDSVLRALEQGKQGLVKRRVTVLAVFLSAFVHEAVKLSREEVLRKYLQVYAIVSEVVSNNRGHIHSFLDGKFVVSFNAVAPTAGQVSRAGTCAVEIREALEEIGITPVHSGFSTGMCHVGEIGEGEYRHHALFGRVLHEAYHLARISPCFADTMCLTTTTIETELRSHFYYQIIDIARFATSSQVTPVGIVSVMWLRESENDGDDEWLYELRKADDGDIYGETNEAFRMFLDGERDAALEKLSALEDSPAVQNISYRALQLICARQQSVREYGGERAVTLGISLPIRWPPG